MSDNPHGPKRALLVCAAPVRGYAALIHAMAHEVDLVIAVDGGARLCQEASVVPDYVIGDLDSADTGTLRELVSNGAVVSEYPADKDETDLELAIAESRGLGAVEIVVCAGFSGRLDHTLAAVGVLAAAHDLRPEVVEMGQHGWVLSASHRPTLQLEAPGDTISIVALTNDVAVTVQGTRWPLAHDPVPLLSSRTVSNVITASVGSVQVHSGVALVMLSSIADTEAG